MAKATETPGQKLDREIAEGEARDRKMAKLIVGLSQEELKSLHRITHVKLYGDGEDD